MRMLLQTVLMSLFKGIFYVNFYICRTDNKASNLNNLADLEGDTLTLYGPPSLEALDRNWGMQAAGAVTVIIFKFIDFDEICKHLQKIRTRFPATQVL
jgi:leucine-rich repeat-containing protein 49